MKPGVIFFDGECNLCNRFVDWVIRRDRAGAFHFASLQGERAKSLPPGDYLSGEGSLVLEESGSIRLRSDAVLAVLRGLGGFWRVFGEIGLLVPRPLREAMYRWVARNRIGWFGRNATCRVPTAEERSRFLA